MMEQTNSYLISTVLTRQSQGHHHRHLILQVDHHSPLGMWHWRMAFYKVWSNIDSFYSISKVKVIE